jgi:hypothetical protein
MTSVRLVLVATLLLVFPGACSGPNADSLNGAWVITWPPGKENADGTENLNSTRNHLTLAADKLHLTGSYIDNDKSSCPLTGDLAAETKKVTIHIDCAQWKIDLNGVASSDSHQIKGAFTALGTSSGDISAGVFTMDPS